MGEGDEVKVKQYLFWQSPSPPLSSETSLQLQLHLLRHTPAASVRENSSSAKRLDSSHTLPLYLFTLGRCGDLHPPQDLPSLPQSPTATWCLLDSTRQSRLSLSPVSLFHTVSRRVQSADLKQTVEECRSTSLLGLRPTHTHSHSLTHIIRQSVSEQ